MLLTETKIVDEITVTQNGIVLYREVLSIVKNDIVIAQSLRRTSLVPGQNLDGYPEQVVAIAQAAWTPEVIAAYQSGKTTNEVQP
jgi:chorismate-pyruvate lyase